MIYPEIDVEDWKLKYGLTEKEWKCPKCGIHYTTRMPVVVQGCAGLASMEHGCGPEFQELVLTPMTKKAVGFWRRVIDALAHKTPQGKEEER